MYRTMSRYVDSIDNRFDSFIGVVFFCSEYDRGSIYYLFLSDSLFLHYVRLYEVRGSYRSIAVETICLTIYKREIFTEF